MKKAALLLIAAMAFAGYSCSGDKNEKEEKTEKNGDAIEAQAFEPTTNIRYVISDSIQSKYTFAEETKQKVQQLSIDYQAYENNLLQQLQNKQNEIQQKYQRGGYMTEASMQQDVQALQQMEGNYRQLLAQRQEDLMAKQEVLARALQDSINNYVEIYNREHHYDAILFKEAALYLNPSLDITAEIVEGLNKRYQPAADTTNVAR